MKPLTFTWTGILLPPSSSIHSPELSQGPFKSISQTPWPLSLKSLLAFHCNEKKCQAPYHDSKEPCPYLTSSYTGVPLIPENASHSDIDLDPFGLHSPSLSHKPYSRWVSGQSTVEAHLLPSYSSAWFIFPFHNITPDGISHLDGGDGHKALLKLLPSFSFLPVAILLLLLPWTHNGCLSDYLSCPRLLSFATSGLSLELQLVHLPSGPSPLLYSSPRVDLILGYGPFFFVGPPCLSCQLW